MKTTTALLFTFAALSLPGISPHLAAQTSGARVVTLHSFVDDGADGVYPAAGLLQANNGYFYGTTSKGGSQNGGAVFRLNPAGTQLIIQYSFTNKDGDGIYPSNGLIQAKDHHLYGTTIEGGTNAQGVVFEMTTTGPAATIYSFGGQGVNGEGNDGASPSGGLVQGSDGNFYGTTRFGGSDDDGTVFRLPSGNKAPTVHSFTGTGTEGVEPLAGLVQGTDGYFYGTTYDGGSQNYGTVFRVTPGGSLTTLHDFVNDGADGIHPEAALVQGRNGYFYGTTAGGGSQNYGTVFRMTPAGKVTVLHSFVNNGTDGITPYSALTQGTDGAFYGTTYYGGSQNYGTVFRMTPAGVLSVLHSFTGTGTDGMYPNAGLIQGTDGLYYGTTEYGGSQDYGTVFRLTAVPFITSATTATATAGEAFSYQITAANGPKSFGARGLPAGLSVNASTGFISGKPKTAGKYTLTLQATNAAGTGTRTLTLNVAAD